MSSLRSRSECIQSATPPEPAGTEFTDGLYWRGVDEIRLRYPEDEQCVWGYIFKPRPFDWQGWDKDEVVEEEDGLSVSLASCTCGHCATTMHPEADRFDGAVKIDLAALGEVLSIDGGLVARFQPEESDNPEHAAHNPCHALMMPARSPLDDLRKKLKQLCLIGGEGWPKKFPKNPQAIALAEQCKSKWDRIFAELHHRASAA